MHQSPNAIRLHQVHAYQATDPETAEVIVCYSPHKDHTAEAAYRRGDQFEKRRKLMETWQAFANSKPTANVVKLKR